MYYFFLIALLSAVIALTRGFEPVIVGGEYTTIEEHPYQVSVQILIGDMPYPRHHCGGSLIKLNIVLSAAHCMNFPFVHYIVRAGSTYSNSGGQQLPLRGYLNHHKYRQMSMVHDYDYDVSLIFLKESFSESRSVTTISLVPEGSLVPDGMVGTVTGWGRNYTQMWKTPQVILKQLHMQKVNFKRCQNLFYDRSRTTVTNRMTCYGYSETGGSGGCRGDSGGPLVIKNYQVGIVSWGVKPCAVPGVPSTIFTDLENDEIRDFIYLNI